MAAGRLTGPESESTAATIVAIIRPAPNPEFSVSIHPSIPAPSIPNAKDATVTANVIYLYTLLFSGQAEDAIRSWLSWRVT